MPKPMEATRTTALDAIVAELMSTGRFADAVAAEKDARQILAEQRQVRDTIAARKDEQFVDGHAVFERLIARAKARLSRT